MAGSSATTWHMLVADDFLLESGRERISASRSCPSSSLHRYWVSHCLGIKPSVEVHWYGSVSSCCWSLTRSVYLNVEADWFMRWATEIAAAPTVHMKAFEEGLGRIMFVAGALEHERPFLGPCMNFSHCTLVTRLAASPAPYAALVLDFLVAEHLEESSLRLQRVPGKIWDRAES